MKPGEGDDADRGSVGLKCSHVVFCRHLASQAQTKTGAIFQRGGFKTASSGGWKETVISRGEGADVFKSLAGFRGPPAPTFHVCHTWERWCHDLNDNYDGGVYLPAEVSQKKKKKKWVEWVQCQLLPRAEREPGREREREGAWKMESGGEGWIVLCARKEKREWLLWCVYMSVRPQSHWSNVCMWLSALKSLAFSSPHINETIMP